MFSKEDTIAPILSKVYTIRQHTLSPSIKLGINPFPLSILPAQFTFLPLTQLHTVRRLIPVARFNVPMIRSDDEPPSGSTQAAGCNDTSESIARLAGYVFAGEIYSSLKPELLRLIREQTRGDANGELRRIEQRSSQRWLGMGTPESERKNSVGSDSDSVRKVRSRESAKTKSINSERSKSSASFDGLIQSPERGDAVLDKVQLRREVGAWWGRKTAD